MTQADARLKRAHCPTGQRRGVFGAGACHGHDPAPPKGLSVRREGRVTADSDSNELSQPDVPTDVLGRITVAQRRSATGADGTDRDFSSDLMGLVGRGYDRLGAASGQRISTLLTRELQRRCWLMMRTGVVLDDAAATVGVSKAVAWRWFREAGGVLPALAPDHPESAARTFRLSSRSGGKRSASYTRQVRVSGPSRGD